MRGGGAHPEVTKCYFDSISASDEGLLIKGHTCHGIPIGPMSGPIVPVKVILVPFQAEVRWADVSSIDYFNATFPNGGGDFITLSFNPFKAHRSLYIMASDRSRFLAAVELLCPNIQEFKEMRLPWPAGEF